MDYEGDIKGVLQRKESSFWQTYHFLLVKDRLLVFDIDKVSNSSLLYLLHVSLSNLQAMLIVVFTLYDYLKLDQLYKMGLKLCI